MSDCHHGSLRIEPGAYRCSQCAAVFERKTPEEHIEAMREVLRHKRYRPPTVDEPENPPPPPIPRKDP